MLATRQHGPVTEIRLARQIWGRMYKDVCAYHVGATLIDSGPPATAGEIRRWAQTHPVQTVVNTHHHEDHVGGNAALFAALGVEPLAPAAALAALNSPPRIPLYCRVVWGSPRPVQAQALGPVLELDEYCFRVIPTPGHSPDHVCLYEPQRKWLFGGDVFVHERVKYIRRSEDIGLILESLHRLLSLDFDTLFCGHAGVIYEAHAAIERKIAWWTTIRQQVIELHDQGVSLPAIRDQVLGPEGVLTQISRGEFSKLNLVRSLITV
jgi:glyoxylase-like metal-dependent hydrolase (beta-lactamase superfamily II)